MSEQPLQPLQPPPHAELPRRLVARRYIVIEGVLTTDEVDELNAAIDHHVPLLNAQPSNAMGGRTPGMIGDRNVHSLIAAHLNEQRGTDLGPVDIMDMLLEAGYPAQGRSVNFGQALSQAERQEIIAEMKSRQSEEVFAAALSNMAPGGVPLSEDEKAAILGLLSTWRTVNDEGSVVRMGTTRTDLNGMLSKRHDIICMLPSDSGLHSYRCWQAGTNPTRLRSASCWCTPR